MQKDFENSVGYYQFASSMGNVQASSNLGYCHLYGRSVEPNRDLAITYFDLAAGRMWMPAISLAIFTVLISGVLRILSCLFTSIAWLQAICLMKNGKTVTLSLMHINLLDIRVFVLRLEEN